MDGFDQFKQNRREQLGEAIGQYLTDESADARQCYEELLTEVNGWVDYFEGHANKARGLRDLLMGYRDVDLAEKWMYDKIPTRY